MPKSQEKGVRVTRRDIYEVRLGDRDPIQLTEDEAGELYRQLGSTFSADETAGMHTQQPEGSASVAAPAAAAPPEWGNENEGIKKPKVINPAKRRRQTVLMAGIVIIVLGIAFASYDFSTLHPPKIAQKFPPPSPYVHLYIQAGVGGGLNFNGTSPGPTLRAPLNDWVWLTFSVASDAGVQHSWVLVQSNVTKVSAPDYTPVFPNATTPNPTAGTPIGGSANIVFKATKAGDYLYICEVPGHFEAGMYGTFIVGNSTNTTKASLTKSFSIVAGLNGTLTFNGTVPGPSMTVSNGTKVSVAFTVSNKSTGNHSWILVPGNATNSSVPNYTPVFTNASSPSPTTGTAPNKTVWINFTANRTGNYKYISEVNSDYKDGMWGWFNVTASNSSAAVSVDHIALQKNAAKQRSPNLLAPVNYMITPQAYALRTADISNDVRAAGAM
jgi:uncharacterized cupredoxin-like copper-binding protein